MKEIMEQYGDMILSGIIAVAVVGIYVTTLKAGGIFSEIVSNYLLSIAG